MRYSTCIGRTLRDAPNEAESAVHQLVLRAGLAQQLLAGGMTLLPLGMRVLRQIERIMHEEMANIDALEYRTPIIQPATLWQESGRYDIYGNAMLRLQNRNEQAMIVAPTHEEAVADIARRQVESYRQLPALIYQIHTKYRDELRVRGGLVRLREFTMLDAYSLDADWAGLDAVYQRIGGAFERIFERCGVKFIKVQASGGDMGGSETTEYMALSADGEDTLLLCAACGYAANSEIATSRIMSEATSNEPMELVATPECKTIAELAQLLQIPESHTAKAVFFDTPERGLIFVVIRGDRQVNEEKVKAAAGVSALQAATLEQIQAVGAVAGYASPVGLHNVYVLADHSIVQAGGLVAGANQEGFHLRNVMHGRDWTATQIADIALAQAGDGCANCANVLHSERGIEIGHIFKLGTRYSISMNANFLDQHGQNQPIIMGSYGIGLERLMHVIVEQHHDDKGIMWDAEVAPFAIHLVRLGKSDAVRAAADNLYAGLRHAGIAVLYDDRDESAGIKFNDADLIGLPLRVVVSERGIKNNTLELKRRATGEVTSVPLGDWESVLGSWTVK